MELSSAKAKEKVTKLSNALSNLPAASPIPTVERKRSQLLEAQDRYEAVCDQMIRLLTDEQESTAIITDYIALEHRVSELSDETQQHIDTLMTGLDETGCPITERVSLNYHLEDSLGASTLQACCSTSCSSGR